MTDLKDFRVDTPKHGLVMSSALKMDLTSALHRFGLSNFRKGQREVIDSVINGSDCLCVMPTGGGKSLCYQLPSIVRNGLTIVVSPLIALMQDQVDTLVKRGIPAALINSTLTTSEQNHRLERVAGGHYNMVYVAPERLRNPSFLEAIRSTPVQLLAIDEAHCISEWGHDFRPDYQRVGRFREALGGVQTIALTATATPRVRQDIVDSLKLKVAKHFITGFARDNLFFGVSQAHSDRDKDKKLLEFIGSKPGSGIIYAATRKRCESLVELLSQELKISVGAYHAGLAPEQRKLIQDQFMRGDLEAIVATNAFGMGIDKRDLRYVVHYNMPGTIEAYYQEAGRAGRDGHSSQCVLLYSAQDRYIQEFFIENANPSREVLKSVYEFLHSRNEDPIELTAEQIRELMNAPTTSEAINSALQVLGKTDALERLEVAGGLAMVRIQSKLPTLVELLPKEATVKRSVLRAVEKAIGDRRDEAVYVNPRWLMKQLSMERDALSRFLRELCSLPGFEYVPPFRGRAIHFRQRDVPFDSLKIDHANLEARKRSDYEKLDQMVSFAQNRQCRQRAILHYFGDTSADKCGICDRCQGRAGWPVIPEEKRAPIAPSISLQLNAPTNDTTSGAMKETSTIEVDTDSDQKPKEKIKKKKIESEFAAAQNVAWNPTELESARALTRKLLGAIERTHGYLSKTVLAQFFSGVDNRAIQGLRLQRLPEYAMLQHWKKAHVTAFLELLLEKSILLQNELRVGKLTLSVSPSGLECIHGIKPIAEDVLQAVCKNESSQADKTPTPPSVVLSAHQGAGNESQGISRGRPERLLERSAESLPRRSDHSSPKLSNFPSPASDLHEPLDRSVKTSVSTEPIGFQDQPEAPIPINSKLPAASIEDAAKVRDPLVGTLQDWEWSLRLAKHGYRLGEVALIRGKQPDQILQDLCDALAAGNRVQLENLFDKRTQIAIREVGKDTNTSEPPLAFASFPRLWDFARRWNSR